LAWDEREHASQRIVAAVTWRGGHIGLRPSFEFVHDYRPLVGFSFFHHGLFGAGTRLHLSLVGGGKEAIVTHVRFEPVPSRAPVHFSIDALYVNRDDMYFHGIDSLAPAGASLPGARYSNQSIDVTSSFSRTQGPVRLGIGDQFGLRRYGPGRSYNDDPSIATAYCARRLTVCFADQVDETLVPGFSHGTQFVRPRVFIDFDTRHSVVPRAGVFGAFVAAFTQGVGSDDSRYVDVSMSLGGSIDLWRGSRFLVLRIGAETLAPLAGTTPFTEVPTLGGPDSMPGFRIGRFRDFSTILGNAEYTWPIWIWADVGLFCDVGAVSGIAWRGLTTDRVHEDIGIALRFRTPSRFFMRVQLAYGINDSVQFSFVGRSGL
jgi:hypothetical protein